MIEFADWIVNRKLPWATYRDLMSRRLIALENKPGVRTAGEGETRCQLMPKCVLWATGGKSKATCGKEQLAGGAEAGIEGVIHDIHLLYTQNSQEEDWGFLLIDTRNALNEENRMAMLWDV